uniref:RHS repeat domain-containing protein n=1 Tax=Marinomonas lutimaris TaxID=2846746 RepID=UPI0024B5A312
GIKTQREFNAFNQLTSFSKEGVLTQYDYDPLGRRIAKHTEQGQIDFIWDGNQLLGECLNGQYTWYINRPNEFHPVALIKQGEVYYYHLDQLNTPRFVTNQAAEVVWENTANAYGYEDGTQQTRAIESTSFYQPIRFQGQCFDQESGFHYNRYRYYCPKQQRFIHQDPIGIVGGINHYQYAPNPVNWVDPMGLLCKEGQAKVAAALEANSVIPAELKEKIIALTKLNDSGYTADEMVRHIDSGKAIEILNQNNDLDLTKESVRKALYEKHGVVVGPYKKLQGITKKGYQREHFIPHSCFMERSKYANEKRSNVPIGKDFGNYNEADAITYFVFDDQSKGTEHRYLTDVEKDYAKSLDQKGEYATVNEWLDHMESETAKSLSMETIERAPGVYEARIPEEEAALVAKAIRIDAENYLDEAGVDKDAKMSNLVGGGDVPDIEDTVIEEF